MNQTDIHAAEKTDRARARSFGGEDADEIRAFMFLENERRNVGKLAYAIDNRKLNIRIVFRNLLHDGRLGKTNSDDEIEVSFGERAHGRLDGVWRTGFDVAQHNRQILCGALHTFPRSSVERAIVLAADIKNDPDVNL